MTPKEKAQQLISKASLYTGHHNEDYFAKQCALIVCDTHIYSENDSPFSTMKEWQANHKYWMQVKEEIKKRNRP